MKKIKTTGSPAALLGFIEDLLEPICLWGYLCYEFTMLCPDNEQQIQMFLKVWLVNNTDVPKYQTTIDA